MKRLIVIVLVMAALALIYVSVKPKSEAGLSLAVTSSFAPFMEAMAQDIQRQCQVEVHISAGSSGTLTTQILNGGPFDMFFSADAAYPRQLLKAGKAKSIKPYAYGRLVYWQPSLKHPDPDDRRPLAMADPALAPYGQASMQSLIRFRQGHDIPTDLVLGRNTAQVFQYVATGAAKAGFVPLSLLRLAGISEDTYIIVPTALYRPLRHELAVLRPSQATDCVLAFIQTPRTKTMMTDAGFGAVS